MSLKHVFNRNGFRVEVTGRLGDKVKVELFEHDQPNDPLFEVKGAWTKSHDAVAGATYWMAQNLHDRTIAGDADTFFDDYTQRQINFMQSGRREDLVELSNYYAENVA